MLDFFKKPKPSKQDWQPVPNALGLGWRFADRCLDRADLLAADIYVTYDVAPLAAARVLADRHGGKVLCNAIECPSMAQRLQPPNWPPAVMATINAAADGFLASCDGILTVSDALGSELEQYGPPVHVIPNYRQRWTPAPTRILRDTLGLPDDAFVVIVPSTLSGGMAGILDALARLPDNAVLVTLGRFISDGFKSEVMENIARLGLARRVFFLPPVPYGEFTQWLSGADAGLYPIDISVRNYMVSLPNRLFDMLAGGVPVIAPRVPDVAAHIEEFGCGVVIDDDTGEQWFAALSRIMENRAAFSRGVAHANEKYTWENIEPKLFDIFAGAKSVCFLGLRNLTENSRTMRMIRSLNGAWLETTIATTFRGDARRDAPATRVVNLEAPLGETASGEAE